MIPHMNEQVLSEHRDLEILSYIVRLRYVDASNDALLGDP